MTTLKVNMSSKTLNSSVLLIRLSCFDKENSTREITGSDIQSINWNPGDELDASSVSDQELKAGCGGHLETLKDISTTPDKTQVDAFMYVVVVLAVYTAAMLVLLIRYMRKNNRDNEDDTDEYYGSNYYKEARLKWGENRNDPTFIDNPQIENKERLKATEIALQKLYGDKCWVYLNKTKDPERSTLSSTFFLSEKEKESSVHNVEFNTQKVKDSVRLNTNSNEISTPCVNNIKCSLCTMRTALTCNTVGTESNVNTNHLKCHCAELRSGMTNASFAVHTCNEGHNIETDSDTLVNSTNDSLLPTTVFRCKGSNTNSDLINNYRLLGESEDVLNHENQFEKCDRMVSTNIIVKGESELSDSGFISQSESFQNIPEIMCV